MTIGSQKLPWISIFCMISAYGFLGWQLREMDAVWVVDSWLIAAAVIVLFIWRVDAVNRVIWLGPRSLVTIFILSMVVTAAIAFSELFGFILVLLLATLLARVELQVMGFQRRTTLVILTLIAGGAMAGGWYLGHVAPPLLSWFVTGAFADASVDA